MAEYRATNQVTVSGHYTFTDAEVIEGDLLGNAVEGAPRHTFALAGSYASQVFTFTAEARYVDDTFQDITNEAPQEAHFIVDLRAGKPFGRALELFIAAQNLFDYEYIADGFGESLGPPRHVSAGLRLRF